MSPRGQLSIETLIIAAALLSFLAFLLPASGRFFDSFKSYSVDSSQKDALQELSFKVNEASLLGSGTRLSFTRKLLADDSTFSFEQNEIKLSYWFAGKQNLLQATSSLEVAFPSVTFPSGNYFFSVYNRGEVISVEIRPSN